MLLVICVLTSLQAYVLTWMIPVYEKVAVAASAEEYDLSRGFNYLLALSIVLTLIVASIIFMGRKK